MNKKVVALGTFVWTDRQMFGMTWDKQTHSQADFLKIFFEIPQNCLKTFTLTLETHRYNQG